MKYPNKTRVFALWTDWNRKGAKGKYGGIGWYRVINPMEKLQNTVTQGEFALGTRDRVKIAKEIGEKADVMLIKYVDSFQAANHLLTIRDFLGIKLIVDIDDNVFKVHPHNYSYKDTAPDTEAYRVFQYLFKEADGLICSTEPLAQEMKAYNKNVWVIPNTIDPEIWKVPVKKNRAKKIRIGWVYGPTHEQDVPLIVPVVKEILKKYPNVEFHHIGWKSEAFDYFANDQQKMVFGTSGYKEFPKFLASLGMDILIAPLIDDEFNRGKSNIKWMEAAMCEIPMVASDVYPYSVSITNGKDGYLAKSTSEWINNLSKLIESKERRVKMGKNAKKTVLSKYQVKDHLKKYVDVFSEVTKEKESEVTAVVTRRLGESDEKTVKSLMRQTYRGIKMVRICDTDGKGANWARNRGLERVKTKYVLFSDNDIQWKLDAVKSLVKTLEQYPEKSYAFGAFTWNFEGSDKKNVQCKERWSADRLKDFDRGNIVSTMTLVRTEDCPGFDENIKKLQDWDLWLTMLGQGKEGIHCEKIIFDTTFSKKGISAANNYQEALKVIKEKHKTL